MKSSSHKSKDRIYQNGEITLTEEEFQEIVEVFQTLAQWDKELKQSKKPGEEPSP